MFDAINSVEDLIKLKEQCETKRSFVQGLKCIIADMQLGDKINLTTRKPNNDWSSSITTSSKFFKEGLVEYLEGYIGSQEVLIQDELEQINSLEEKFKKLLKG